MCCHTTLHLKSLAYGVIRPGSADVSLVVPVTNSDLQVGNIIIYVVTYTTGQTVYTMCNAPIQNEVQMAGQLGFCSLSKLSGWG